MVNVHCDFYPQRFRTQMAVVTQLIWCKLLIWFFQKAFVCYWYHFVFRFVQLVLVDVHDGQKLECVWSTICYVQQSGHNYVCVRYPLNREAVFVPGVPAAQGQWRTPTSSSLPHLFTDTDLKTEDRITTEPPLHAHWANIRELAELISFPDVNGFT